MSPLVLLPVLAIAGDRSGGTPVPPGPYAGGVNTTAWTDAEARRFIALAEKVSPRQAVAVLHDPQGEVTRTAAGVTRSPVIVIGMADPATLLGGLTAAGVRGRVTPILAEPARAVPFCPWPVGLLSLPVTRSTRAEGAAWADRVVAGGWIVLRGGSLSGPRDLDLTPAKWDVFPGGGRLFSCRRRGVG